MLKRTFIVNLVLACITLLVSFVFCEIISRAYFGNPMPMKIMPQVRYDFHEARRFTLRPEQVSFTYSSPVHMSSNGYRIHNMQSRDIPDIKFLALGDSFTFGFGVADDETWPARLERKLSEKYRKTIQVINSGTVSYGVFQEMDLFREKGIKINPHVVIHGLYWNDFMSASAPEPGTPSVLNDDGYFVWDLPPDRNNVLKYIFYWFSSKSSFITTAIFRIKAIFDREKKKNSLYGDAYARFIAGEINPDEWRPVEEFYKELQELSILHEFQIYVVILPVIDLIDKPGHPYSPFIHTLLDSMGIKYFDALELWQENKYGEATFLPQGVDAHLNVKGYEIITNHLIEKLEKDKIVTSLLN